MTTSIRDTRINRKVKLYLDHLWFLRKCVCVSECVYRETPVSELPR